MFNYIVDVHGLYKSTYHSAGPPFSRFKQLRPTPGMVKLISEIVHGALGEASTLLAGWNYHWLIWLVDFGWGSKKSADVKTGSFGITVDKRNIYSPTG